MSAKIVKVGLSWDLTNKNDPVDLDLSCATFNEYGKLLDCAYYNKTATDDGSVVAVKGDSRDGKQGGDDEQLLIDFSKAGAKVTGMVLVVTCHTGHTLSKIASGRVEIRDAANGQALEAMVLRKYGDNTAAILFAFERENKWVPRAVHTACYGRTFEDLKEEMRKVLTLDQGLVEEMRFDLATERTFDMKKGQTLGIDGIKQVMMGMGWDSKCDVDSSCVMMVGNRVHETIYYGRLGSREGSIKHSGDNLTGDGDGDDERINVDLTRVPPNVTALLFVVTIFSSGKSFKDVKGLYARMVNTPTNKDICKYQISGSPSLGAFNAMVVCNVYRNARGAWSFKAIGETETGRTASDLERAGVFSKYL